MLWCWVLGLLAFSSFLGALAHGFETSDIVHEALWKPLSLGLAIIVALFVVGVAFFGLTEYPGKRSAPFAVSTEARCW